MPYEVYQTSAENIIGAADAAVQKPDGVDENLVAAFLDTTMAYAQKPFKWPGNLALLWKRR